MHRWFQHIVAPFRRRSSLKQLLQQCVASGARNPDLEPAPVVLRGSAVYQVPVAYRIGDRTGQSTVRLAVHPSTPRSAIVAAALRKVQSDLPTGATLRLVSEPILQS